MMMMMMMMNPPAYTYNQVTEAPQIAEQRVQSVPVMEAHDSIM
jgi:hypothetical protein